MKTTRWSKTMNIYNIKYYTLSRPLIVLFLKYHLYEALYKNGYPQPVVIRCCCFSPSLKLLLHFRRIGKKETKYSHRKNVIHYSTHKKGCFPKYRHLPFNIYNKALFRLKLYKQSRFLKGILSLRTPMCRHRSISVHERETICVYVNWLFAETHDFSTL